MTRPRVALGSLGGTITMTPGCDQSAVSPELGAEQLIAGVPGLAEEFDLVVETLARRPGASLTPHDVAGAVKWAGEQVEAGCAGVVLVQGTDTLPETSFLADLYWSRAEPLVFTGAMRPPKALSADGPANLAAACRVAAAPAIRELGATVVMDQHIHLASRVAKGHSWHLGAFSSGAFGVAGVVTEERVQVVATTRPERARVPLPVSDPDVALWATHLGDTGVSLSRMVAGGVAGVVVDAFGVGHVPERLAHVLSELAQRLPVVVCASAERGGTFERTYGFTGSETDLLQRGVLLGGALPARKVRLQLWALLAARTNRDEVRAAFVC